MLNQKVQNLLLVAVIAIPITTVTYLLISGSNGVAAQVQGLPGLHSPVTELLSDEQQETDTNLVTKVFTLIRIHSIFQAM
jgi:hypothetical protein